MGIVQTWGYTLKPDRCEADVGLFPKGTLKVFSQDFCFQSERMYHPTTPQEVDKRKLL